MACLLIQQTAIAQPGPPDFGPPCGGPFGPPCLTVLDGLVAYYPLNEGEFLGNGSFGVNLSDYSGNNNYPTSWLDIYYSDAGISESYYSTSAGFNGQTSQIEIPSISLHFSDYSVSYWIAPDQIPPAQTQVVMMQQSGYGASQIGWNSLIEPNGKLNFIGGNGEGQPQSVCNYGTLTPGIFNHVVQVFTPTQAIVYVNGIKKGYYNHNGAVVGYSGSPLVIGLGNVAIPNTTGFTGLLDEIAIYNRALDATEVLAVFNNIPVEEAMNLPLQEDLENETAYPSATTGIPYQAEVRTETGELYANGYVQVRFSLHEFTPDGTISYQEYHDLTTNELGLLSAYIGNGLVVHGEFNSINWAQARKFLQVEIHFGDGQWITMGNQQLMSVPYALYAANVPAGLQGPQGEPGPAGPQGPQGPAGASSFRGVKTQFCESGTWVCPEGVYQVTVELWGAGGGACYRTVGGTGGSGGYNRAIISVNPGQSYIVDIGTGGVNGSNFGTAGSTSNFGNSISAAGGGGGSEAGSYFGNNGTSGAVINWPYENCQPSYIPNQSPSLASGGRYCTNCVGGGGGSIGAEPGFCIISY